MSRDSMLEDFWRLSGPLARALRVSVIKKEASEPPPCWACPEAQRPKFVVKCRPAALSRYCGGEVLSHMGQISNRVRWKQSRRVTVFDIKTQRRSIVLGLAMATDLPPFLYTSVHMEV